MASSQCPRWSLGDLPDVLLAGALDYSDLREVAACAAASSQLRDGLRRLSPALERRLVFRRFPILSTIDASAEAPPPPRELFLSQTRLFAAERPALPPLSRSFDEYVFSIELELVISHRSDQGVVTTSRESIFVGKGEVIGGDQHALVAFCIPANIFYRAWESRVYRPRPDLYLRVMASKGFSRARLGHGTVDNYEDHAIGQEMIFYNLGLAPSHSWRHGEMGGLDWLQNRQLDAENFHIPTVEAYWNLMADEVASTLDLSFRWQNQNGVDLSSEMTREDAARGLEHYAEWT